MSAGGPADGPVDPVDLVTMSGGLAVTADLVPPSRPRELRAAVDEGRLVRTARGSYALPSVSEAERHRARLSGTLTHLSAAQHHGWEIARDPDLPWIGVPRNRKVPTGRRKGVHLSWTTARGVATDPVRTVIDCARTLPFADALAVADSALRHDVPHDALEKAAGEVRGKGAAQARRVAAEASLLAANPLESALRALALDAGLAVVPQVSIELPERHIRPDLVDESRRLVIEAEGFAFHGGSLQFSRDVWRYTSLAVRGWTVLRFTWRHVMEEPDWVSESLDLFLQTCKPARKSAEWP